MNERERGRETLNFFVAHRDSDEMKAKGMERK